MLIWFIFVSTTARSLQQQEKYHTGTVRPKSVFWAYWEPTMVPWGNFGPTGACRDLPGQFLWPTVCTIMYCILYVDFQGNSKYAIPIKILSLPYFT